VRVSSDRFEMHHLPSDFITSKGTPRRRYSRVDPMRVPCPCRGSKPAAFAAPVSALMNAGLASGR